jgi:methyl-accepting chemotaxis protein
VPLPETSVLHVRPTPRYLVDARFQLKYTALLCGLVLALLMALGVLLWRTADTAAAVAGGAVGQAEQLVREQQASAGVAKVNEMAGAEDPSTVAAIEKAYADVERKGLENLSEVNRQRLQIEANRRRMRLALGGGGLVLLLLVALAGLYITRRVTAPVFKLKRLLRKVGTGRLVVRERPSEHDELQDLFDTFLQMTYSLRELQADWLRTVEDLLAEAQAGGDANRLESRLRELREQISRGVGQP